MFSNYHWKVSFSAFKHIAFKRERFYTFNKLKSDSSDDFRSKSDTALYKFDENGADTLSLLGISSLLGSPLEINLAQLIIKIKKYNADGIINKDELINTIKTLNVCIEKYPDEPLESPNLSDVEAVRGFLIKIYEENDDKLKKLITPAEIKDYKENLIRFFELNLSTLSKDSSNRSNGDLLGQADDALDDPGNEIDTQNGCDVSGGVSVCSLPLTEDNLRMVSINELKYDQELKGFFSSKSDSESSCKNYCPPLEDWKKQFKKFLDISVDRPLYRRLAKIDGYVESFIQFYNDTKGETVKVTFKELRTQYNDPSFLELMDKFIDKLSKKHKDLPCRPDLLTFFDLKSDSSSSSERSAALTQANSPASRPPTLVPQEIEGLRLPSPSPRRGSDNLRRSCLIKSEDDKKIDYYLQEFLNITTDHADPSLKIPLPLAIQSGLNWFQTLGFVGNVLVVASDMNGIQASQYKDSFYDLSEKRDSFKQQSTFEKEFERAFKDYQQKFVLRMIEKFGLKKEDLGFAEKYQEVIKKLSLLDSLTLDTVRPALYALEKLLLGDQKDKIKTIVSATFVKQLVAWLLYITDGDTESGGTDDPNTPKALKKLIIDFKLALFNFDVKLDGDPKFDTVRDVLAFYGLDLTRADDLTDEGEKIFLKNSQKIYQVFKVIDSFIKEKELKNMFYKSMRLFLPINIREIDVDTQGELLTPKLERCGEAFLEDIRKISTGVDPCLTALFAMLGFPKLFTLGLSAQDYIDDLDNIIASEEANKYVLDNKDDLEKLKSLKGIALVIYKLNQSHSKIVGLINDLEGRYGDREDREIKSTFMYELASKFQDNGENVKTYDSDGKEVLDKKVFFDLLDEVHKTLEYYLITTHTSKSALKSLAVIDINALLNSIKNLRLKKLVKCYFQSVQRTNDILIDEMKVYHTHRDILFKSLYGNPFFEAFISILDAWVYKDEKDAHAPRLHPTPEMDSAKSQSVVDVVQESSFTNIAWDRYLRVPSYTLNNLYPLIEGSQRFNYQQPR